MNNILDEIETHWVAYMRDEEKRAEAAARHRAKAEALRSQEQAETAERQAVEEQIEFWEGLASETLRGFELAMPTLMFEDELNLDMGDLTLRAIFFGKGHSRSDLVIHIPEEKVLVSSGTCYAFFPRIKEHVELGDLKRSVSVLEGALNHPGGLLHVVPAHMDLLGRQDVERLRDYYRGVLSGVTAIRAEGAGLVDARTRLALDRRFPFMSGVESFRGTPQELHEENIDAIWRLLDLD